MELNEVHTSHEHATTSMKVLLLIFSVLLLTTLGYFVWDYKNTPDATDYSAQTVMPTDSSEVATTTETEKDPCDFSTVTTTVKAGVTFDTMGGENFSTLVCGYLTTKEGDVGLGEVMIKNLAYIAVTKFKDAGFEAKIKEAIAEGNTVNATQDGAYLLGCGCLEDGKLTANPAPNDWMSASDQAKLIASSATKPVMVKLTYEVHGGSGCSCCSLFEKAEVL